VFSRHAAGLRRRARQRGAERLRPDLRIFADQHQTGHALHVTFNTPAAADFMLSHAAKPDRGNGSLRFVHGAAGYLAMAKLLPVIFALRVAAWRTKSRFSVGGGLRLHG